MDIRIRRAYEEPGRGDGYRVLVDRVWPRGVRREALAIDDWPKDVAPSDGLRRWFGHDPEKWPEFRDRYFAELRRGKDAVEQLVERVREGRVTLVYGARDEEHNNAVALREYLRKRVAS